MNWPMLKTDNKVLKALDEAVALRKTWSPVDRALEYADQQQSFVRGMVSHTPDFSEDALSVLAAEVRRLRS